MIALVVLATLVVVSFFSASVFRKKAGEIEVLCNRCDDGYAAFLRSVSARNDAILNFVGAARHCNLSDESLVSELLHLRASSLTAENPKEILFANDNTSHSLREMETRWMALVTRAPDNYRERLDALTRANQEVDRLISVYREERASLDVLTSRLLIRLALRIKPRSLPPSA